jgi:release factor glutamine methyltransferase
LSDPYRYSEDSRLLWKALSDIGGAGVFLEIGVGSGGNISKLSHQRGFDRIIGTDLMNLAEIRNQVPKSVELVNADRASCFRGEIFDLIAFNPPYLPSEEILDLATDGGRGGIEVPLQFMESALSVLRTDGRILMVLSSDDAIDEVKLYCERHELLMTKVSEAGLFFETLFVFQISRKSSKSMKAP